MKKIIAVFLAFITSTVWADQFIRFGGGSGSASGASIGDHITGGTAGSVLFVDGSGNLSQDNAHFFWDYTNFRLGIGNSTPGVPLDVTGIGRFSSGIITPLIYPNANSTTAVKITKADGTTNIVDIDTTNSRVGIGTTAPASLLDVGGGKFNVTSAGNVGIGSTAPATLLDVGPTTLNVTAGGRVGIGTNTPATLLDVGGGEFNVTSGGSVGIGTSAPSVSLEDFSSANSALIAKVNNTNAAGNAAQAVIQTVSDAGAGSMGTTSTGFAGSVGASVYYFNANGLTNGMLFQTTANTQIKFITNSVERIRILGSGETGFGVSAPNETVEVNGGVRLHTAKSRPTCDSTKRGDMWVTENGAGVTDVYAICLKSAADTYNWIQIVTGG